nr:MAG TPA: tail tape measure [Caudoviricetes sp.]
MANKLEIEIGGKTVQLEKSLKTVTAAISQAKREANELSKDMKLDPTNADLVVKRHEQLAQALALSTEKAKILKEDLDKIDPDVDPSAYFRLAKQVANAERESRSLTRQLSVSESAVKRLNATAGTFRFDPGTGVREFGKSIEGIDAAISTLGNQKEIINFNRSKAGFDEVKANFAQLDKLAELLTKRVNVLDTELSHIDVKADPKGFAEITKQINETKAKLKAIGDAKAEAHVVLHDGVTNKARGIVATIKDITKAPGTVTEKLKNLSSVGLEGLTNTLKSAPKAIVSNLGHVAKTGVSAVGGMAVDAAAQMGTAVVKTMSTVWGTVGRLGVEGIKSAGSAVKGAVTGAFSAVGGFISRTIVGGMSGIGHAITGAITAPFKGIASGIGTIVRGSLLTVGQNITNAVSGTVKGAVASMEEAQKSAKSLKNVLDFSDVDSGTIDKLTKDMADYAKTTTYGSSELNKVVAGLVSSNVEANKAGDLTKNIANAYSLLGDGSRKLSDIGVIFSQINSAGKLMAQDFSQLRDAGLGGAIKKEIERNFPDIIKQFGSFQAAMEKGAISAEMVDQAVAKIGQSDAAKKAATVPKTMGEAFETLQETLGQKFQSVYSKLTAGGIDFVSKLTDKIDGMDFSPITKGLESAFSKVSGIGDIIKNAIKGVDFSTVLDGVVKVFDIIGAKTKAVFEVLKTIGQHINFGDVFRGALDVLKQISDAVGTVIKGIGSMVEKIDWNKTFEGAGHVISSILDAVKSIAKTLGDAFASDTMQGALGAVGNLIKQIVDSVKSVADSPIFKKVVDGLISLVGSAADVITGLIKSISEAFKNSDTISHIVEGVKDIGKNLSDMVKTPGFQEFVTGTLGVLSTVLGGIVSLAKDVSGAFKNMLGDQSNADTIKETFEGINNAIAQIFSVIKGVGKAIFDAFANPENNEKIQNAFQNIKGIFEDIKNFIESDAFQAILTAFAGLSASLLSAATNIGQAITGAFNDPTINENITGIADNIKGIGDTIDNFTNSKGFQTYVQTIITNFTAFGDAVSDVFGKALKIVTDFFAGADFSQWGKTIDTAIDVVKSFLDSALQPIQDAIDEMKETGILDFLWQSFSELSENIGKLIKNVKPFTDFLGWLIGSIVAEGLKGIASTLGIVSKALGTFVGWISDLVGAIGKLGENIWNWVKDTFFGSADGASHDGAQYASYGNYSSASTINNNSSNAVHININPAPGMDVTSLARQIRHEVELGLA